jgi:hypothetical protein
MLLTRRCLLAALLLLCACKRSPAEGTPVPPPEAGEAQLPSCPSLETAGDATIPPTRAQAVAFAEAFVRAAGYTDSPATCLAPEFLFGPHLAQRRGQLQAKAYATMRVPLGWAVVFLYDPQWLARLKIEGPDGTGREVRIDDRTGEATVVHQDAIVEFFDRLIP